MADVEHILTDADSVQTLAALYYNDASRWKEIVDYNQLEYPYIISTSTAELYAASGYVTLTRELALSDLTVFKGSSFGSKINAEGIQKLYEVVEDTMIPTGQTSGYILVRSNVIGTYGNTIANSIRQVVDLKTNLGGFVGVVSVNNDNAFTNGSDARVKMTGQSLFIPLDAATSANVADNSDTFINLFGGTDLKLGDDLDIVDDGFGDIGTSVGMDNIMQAVKHRLMTEAGTIVQHPDYGTRLASLIGQAQLPYVNKLIEFNIYEALSFEDRVSSALVNSIEIVETSIYLDLTVEINKQGSFTQKLKLDF
jgi:phage baseplate assembly protein W